PLSTPVLTAAASAVINRHPQAAAALRTPSPSGVAVATHLLAPGFFADRAAATGARWTSAPLGTHEALARLIALRYDEARARAESLAVAH
ncbi:sirohydrochlorin chelatase, partial [Kitasatospora purpeofusca]